MLISRIVSLDRFIGEVREVPVAGLVYIVIETKAPICTRVFHTFTHPFHTRALEVDRVAHHVVRYHYIGCPIACWVAQPALIRLAVFVIVILLASRVCIASALEEGTLFVDAAIAD